MATKPDAPSSSATSAAQLNEELTKGLSSADSISVGSMQTLQRVHLARRSNLSRTSAGLKARLGDKDPRVQEAEAAVAAAATTAARVSMASQQLATPAPQVATGGWALHGRVFHSDLQPAAHYTVFLVDAQKNYQQQYGFAYTDETGYFEINFAGPAIKSASQSFLEIVNTKEQPVYLATTPFQPATGSVTYQNVNLPAGEKPLGDPPREIRAVAFPKQEKKK